MTSQENSTSPTLTAPLYFLARDRLYETEKPYHIQYEPHGDVPQSNVGHVKISIPIRDVRPVKDELSLEKDGMVVRGLHSKMRYEDYADPIAVQDIYLKEIHELLQNALETRNISMLEYLVRRRHQSYPMPPKKNFEFAQPVATPHIDFSPKCIEEILIDRYGHERTQELCQFPYKIFNLWKPLFGPVEDWPLALCHRASLNVDEDYELTDNVYPLNVEESIQLYHNEHQDWCYVSEQSEFEVLIFQGGDSEMGMLGGIPHCSFFNSGGRIDARPRESIEVRALVFYSDTDLALDRLLESRRHGPKSTYSRQKIN